MWYDFSPIKQEMQRNWRMFIVLLLISTSTTTVSGECPECTMEDQEGLRMKCQIIGAKLTESEATQNATIVCQFLHEMFLCVGEKVPQCLDRMYEVHEQYTQTPWDCHPTPEQLHHYQVLNKNGCLDTVTMGPESSSAKTGSQSSGDPANAATTSIVPAGFASCVSVLLGSLLIRALQEPLLT